MQGDEPLTYGESRIMNSLDYEIYHFYDSRSRHIRLHHHDFFELYYLRAGKMEYIVDGRRYTLNPGSMLFITPDQLHRPDIIGTENFERFVLWINPAFMANNSSLMPGLSGALFSGTRVSSLLIPDEAQRKEIEALLLSLYRETGARQEYHTLMCHLFIIQLLVYVRRMMLCPPQTDAVPARPNVLAPDAAHSDTQLQEVFIYIQDHLQEDLSIGALSDRFFFNPNTLARRFKKLAGIPLGEYVREKRLAAARLYIYQGMNAVQAGEASGFADYSTFYRAFRQEYGVSPKHFAAACHTQP